jgi:DNA-binding NarL/FixJ family response regulator
MSIQSVAVRQCSGTTEGQTLVLHITPAERTALQLLADGKATEDIAWGLGLSERTVELQLTTLFERMGAASRTEAVAAAWRRGLLSVVTLPAQEA